MSVAPHFHSTYSTKLFDYHKESKTFLVDCSTLIHATSQPLFGRIYNDAADEGLILISHTTGAPLVFYVDEIVRNSDDDIAMWKLKMCPETQRANPSLEVYITIFNT